MKNRKINDAIFIINLVIVLIALSLIIPFSSSSFTGAEMLYKYLIAPFVAFALVFVILLLRGTYVDNNEKFPIFGSYMPGYMILFSLGLNTIFTIARTTSGFYTYGGWLLNFAIVSALLVFIPIRAFKTVSSFFRMKRKEIKSYDIRLFFIALAVVLYLSFAVFRYVNIQINATGSVFVHYALLFALALIICSYYIYRLITLHKRSVTVKHYSRQELLAANGISIDYNEDGSIRIQKNIEAPQAASQVENTKTVRVLEPIYVKPEPIKEVKVIKTVKQIIQKPDPKIIEEIEVVKVPKVITVKETVYEEKEVEVCIDEIVKEFVEVKDQESYEKLAEAKKANESLRNEHVNLFQQYSTQKVALEARRIELVEIYSELIKEPEKKIIPKVEVQKQLVPSFAELVKHAKNLPYVQVKEESPESYRFYVDNKVLFLILKDTPREHRLTFLISPSKVKEFATKPSFLKAKSPVGFEWYRILNRGEWTVDELYAIIDGALIAVPEYVDRVAREKAEKRLASKLEKMTDEQRKRYFEKLAKQEKEVAEQAARETSNILEAKKDLDELLGDEVPVKEIVGEDNGFDESEVEADTVQEDNVEEDSLLDQELADELVGSREGVDEDEDESDVHEDHEASDVENETSALELLKQEKLAQKQAEKEKAKQIALEEKEKSQLHATDDKEKEKQEAVKAKEKEKQDALKAKEKEKAKLAAQKEKEKLAAQKAKEKEKEKLAEAKAKEKEKAKLALEKEKEKEKLAAQKAKEKEKLALEKEKEKEKEKLASLKAKEKETLDKEKEKEKLAAQKAKDKEKEKEALEKEKEKEKLAAQKAKEKEKEKEKLALEKEKAKLAAQKEKEKEKAKLAAQKEKEKEKAKLAAQKEKEKEKAKLAAQKEKEKLAAEKAKAKEVSSTKKPSNEEAA